MFRTTLMKAFIEDEVTSLPEIGQRNFIRRVFPSRLFDGSLAAMQELDRICRQVCSDDPEGRRSVLGDFCLDPHVAGSCFRIGKLFAKDCTLCSSDNIIDGQAFVTRQLEVAQSHHLFRRDDITDLRRIMHILLGDRYRSHRHQLRHGPGLTSEGLTSVDKNIAHIPPDLMTSWLMGDISPEWKQSSESTLRTRIRFVPKNWKSSRVIGMEPVWKMCHQLALKGDLETQLHTWIPFSDQREHSRKMCDSCWRYPVTTIDLSEASDRISVELARAICPNAWYDDMSLCRTSEYDLDGVFGKTSSFALMGNGFCFPFLSATVLACGFLACMRTFDLAITRNSMRLLQRDYGVSTFGDDLIIPEVARDRLRSVLAYQGLLVNEEKSGNAWFRECCGLYEFRGASPFRLYACKNSGSDSSAILHLCALQNDLHDAGYSRSAHVIRDHFPHIPSTTSRRVRGVAFFADHDTLTQFSKRRSRFEFCGLRLMTKRRKILVADTCGVLGFLTHSLGDYEVWDTHQLTYGFFPYN